MCVQAHVLLFAFRARAHRHFNRCCKQARRGDFHRVFELDCSCILLQVIIYLEQFLIGASVFRTTRQSILKTTSLKYQIHHNTFVECAKCVNIAVFNNSLKYNFGWLFFCFYFSFLVSFLWKNFWNAFSATSIICNRDWNNKIIEKKQKKKIRTQANKQQKHIFIRDCNKKAKKNWKLNTHRNRNILAKNRFVFRTRERKKTVTV